MIQSDFYPTAVEATYGTLGDPDYEHFAFTDSLLDLDIDTTDIADPYLMGYMGYDQVPRMAQLSKVEYTSNEIIFRIVSDENVNVPWFYTSGCTNSYTQSAGVTGQSGYINYNDGNGWALFAERGTGTKYCRFINDINIQCINERILEVCFTYYFQYSSSMPWGYSYSWATQWISFSNTQEFLDFVNGDVTKSIVAGDTTIELNGTDFGSGQNAYPGTYTRQGETEDITIVVSITGFRISSNRDVSYGPGTGDSRGFSTLATGYKMKSTEIGVDYIVSLGDYYESSFHPYGNNNYSYLSVKRTDLAGGTLTFGDSNDPLCGFLLDSDAYVLGGFDMTIPMEFITGAVSGSPLTRGFNLLEAVGTPGNADSTIRIHAIYPISKILEAAQQRTNITKGASKWYGVTDQSYYPKYNEDNSPAWELVNGEPDEVIPQLRDWQLGRIYDNDFTWEDIPPYVPPGPGPGGDGDEGKIPLNIPGALGATNAFTTRYVLNTTQIRTIGRQLWSTLGDGNELTWQNFFLTLTGSDSIDYSLTLSEIISYFINLKYFPFSLSSISTSTGEAGIRIGTGKSLISAGSTTKVLTDPIIQLNGGTVEVPSKWSNYMDLEPYCTASIYIPYCGTTEVPVSVILGARLGLNYLVDLTTGAITAVVMKYSGSGAYFPIVVMNGSCGFDILMTGTNGNSQMTNAIGNLASKSTQWTGQVLQSGLTGLMGGISGRDASGFGGLTGMANTAMGIGQDMIQQNIQMPKLYATAPMTAGSSSSLSSLILPQTAYVQLRRHNPYRLSGENYQDQLGLIGARSAYQGQIVSANGMGFVKCQNPNLAPVIAAGATEAEINKIKSLLTDGIFT